MLGVHVVRDLLHEARDVLDAQLHPGVVEGLVRLHLAALLAVLHHGEDGDGDQRRADEDEIQGEAQGGRAHGGGIGGVVLDLDFFAHLVAGGIAVQGLGVHRAIRRIGHVGDIVLVVGIGADEGLVLLDALDGGGGACKALGGEEARVHAGGDGHQSQ